METPQNIEICTQKYPEPVTISVRANKVQKQLNVFSLSQIFCWLRAWLQTISINHLPLSPLSCNICSSSYIRSKDQWMSWKLKAASKSFTIKYCVLAASCERAMGIWIYQPLKMGRYPVHLQRFPCMERSMSSNWGTGLFRRSVYMDITMPGVQKPHCDPWNFDNLSFNKIFTMMSSDLPQGSQIRSP